MRLMHHNVLRVNAAAPEADEVMEIYAESGWLRGAHKDTDPDDIAAGVDIPRVLPEPKSAAKTGAKTKD